MSLFFSSVVIVVIDFFLMVHLKAAYYNHYKSGIIFFGTVRNLVGK